MSSMSCCVLTRAERPGVSLATLDNARDVLAIASRNDRKENILMPVDLEIEEPVEIGGRRFKPACLYLQWPLSSAKKSDKAAQKLTARA